MLLDTLSPENVGPHNYVEKVNWRRFGDGEIVREGYVPFTPTGSVPHAVIPQPCRGIWEATRPNGERCLVSATPTALHKFDYSTGIWSQIGSGFTDSNKRWQGCSSDGWLFLNNTVDLPVAYRIENATVIPLYELREVGVSCVGTLCANNGFLLLGDITEIQAATLPTWMNGATPYGVVPGGSTNRIRYKIVCSDYLKPTNFSPVISGTIQSASKTVVTLDYPSTAFVVGAKVAVVGAGINGGTLGGTEGVEDGVPITAASGKTITLSIPADSALTYPLMVSVTRWADTSTFSSGFSLQDDGSAILRIMSLKRQLLVFRETGIFSGRYTGNVETPFIFTPEFQGSDVPVYPDAAIEIAGEMIVYPTKSRFYYFDGSSAPQIFKSLDAARSNFFSSAQADPLNVFASHNEVTREVWFHTAAGVLAFDYFQKTAAWIDEPYSGGATIQIPSTGEHWYVLVRSDGVYRCAANESGVITRKRNGTSVVATLKSGMYSIGDESTQKTIRGYLPLLGVGCQDTRLEVTLYGSEAVSLSPRVLCSVQLPAPGESPLISAFFRNTYLQDKISYIDPDDKPCFLSGRSLRMILSDTRGVTRHDNGNR